MLDPSFPELVCFYILGRKMVVPCKLENEGRQRPKESQFFFVINTFLFLYCNAFYTRCVSYDLSVSVERKE